MLDQREEETMTENEGKETSPFPCDLISYISVSSSDRFLSKDETLPCRRSYRSANVRA
jgi:hypothetical protein